MWKNVGEIKSSSQQIKVDDRHNLSGSGQGCEITTMAIRDYSGAGILAGKEWYYNRRILELTQIWRHAKTFR